MKWTFPSDTNEALAVDDLDRAGVEYGRALPGLVVRGELPWWVEQALLDLGGISLPAK